MKPHDYNLYHYTKSLKTLNLILENGFWPRYSLEDFSWLEPNLFIACPCVCFCDIPLAASSMHREDYGSYVISFDKTWTGTEQLTPLLYVNDKGPLARTVFGKFKRELTKAGAVENMGGKMHFTPAPLNKGALDTIWPFLPYFKATLGHTLQPKSEGQKAKGIRPEYDHTWLTKYLEDEMEWRYVPEKYRDALYSVRDYDRKTLTALAGFSEKTKDAFLKFELVDVQSVIVLEETERVKVIADFPELKDKVSVWAEIPQ